MISIVLGLREYSLQRTVERAEKAAPKVGEKQDASEPADASYSSPRAD